jgi:hypothetical protein
MMMGPAPMMRTECMSVRFGIVKPPQIEHGLDWERKEKGALVNSGTSNDQHSTTNIQ